MNSGENTASVEVTRYKATKTKYNVQTRCPEPDGTETITWHPGLTAKQVEALIIKVRAEGFVVEVTCSQCGFDVREGEPCDCQDYFYEEAL